MQPEEAKDSKLECPIFPHLPYSESEKVPPVHNLIYLPDWKSALFILFLKNLLVVDAATAKVSS